MFQVLWLTEWSAQEREEAVNNPRKQEIQLEIRQFERKIDDVKRKIEDEMLILDRLKSSVATQNALATLKEQCGKEIEALEESIRDETYSLAKFGITAPESLPRDDDITGENLAKVAEAMDKAARTRLSQANARLKTADDAVEVSQRDVSERTAMLTSSQRALSTAQTRLQGLATVENEFNTTVEQLVEHSSVQGYNFNGDPQNPKDVIRFLEKNIELVDGLLITDAPKIAKKVGKKVAKGFRETYAKNGNKCPCCKSTISEDTLYDFLNIVFEKSSAVFPDQGEDEVARNREVKNYFQSCRKKIEAQKESLQEMHRVRQEVAAHEKEVKRLQDELARLGDENRKNREQKTKAEAEVNDLRTLGENIRRWNDDSCRVTEKKQQIIQKKNELASAGHDCDRDLKTVETDVAKMRDEKDSYATEISRRNREVSEMNKKESRLASTVRMSFFYNYKLT